MTRLNKVTLAVASAATLTILAGASAAAQQNPSDWNRPYGGQPGQETQPYQGARDANGNRVVLNGIIQTGVGVQAQAQARANASASANASSGGVGDGNGQAGWNASSATAIGNQLNVLVNGNYNTVVVNSRQTNNGDVSANSGAGQASSNTGAETPQ